MKKIVVCLLAFAFVASVAGLSFGRTMNEEALAVRDYLKVIDAKLAIAKKTTNSAKVNLLHKQKAATLERWNKLQASMAPAPVASVATPDVIVVMPVKKASRGVAMYVNGGLDAGLTGFAGNLEYDLGGRPIEGIKLRIGVNYIGGYNPNGNDLVKALSAKLGAVYYITPYLPSIGIPLTWYVGGAYLLPYKMYNDKKGSWGAEAYIGANYDIPEMGLLNFELGYGALKYDVAQPALKGLDLKVGYGIAF